MSRQINATKSRGQMRMVIHQAQELSRLSRSCPGDVPMTEGENDGDDERLRRAGLLPGQLDREAATRARIRSAEHHAAIARKTELRGAWDPAHVEARLVEAYGVLRRI